MAGRWNPQEETLETATIRPKKSDMTIRLVGLSWAPLWMDPQGEHTPAWEETLQGTSWVCLIP